MPTPGLTSEPTVKADWINPFIESTVNTFLTVLNCNVVRGQLHRRRQSQPAYEISGVMSLEGKAKGCVVVSFEHRVAVEATKHVMGHSSGMIDEDAIDVVCEITNMIAGGANNALEHLSMKIGLPSVVSGKNHVISFPPGVVRVGIPFETDWGPIVVDAGIMETGPAAENE